MKLVTFFDNFELMSDAPNGVQKLREMILQLAVQGKLVPQDPKDKPASVLFEKIKVEKERLVKEKKIKKPKPLPSIKPDEIPYELPKGWEWVRLGNIANYGEGGKVSSNDIPENAWLLDLADIEKDTSRIVNRVKFKDRISKSTKAEFKKDDVLYGKLRPYLNKVVVADENGFCTTEIIPIRGYSGVFPKYLMYSLRSPRFLDYVDSKTYGTKMPRLGTEDAKISLSPLPPTNEQKRIVSKIDELLALCDELEARKQKISINCVQLNDISIHKLLAVREPKKFSNHWQRICNNFDLLYSKPENVVKLRQAILQLAVQGKLVPQDPKDEPASVLLEKIKAEKENLIIKGKIKKSKPLPPIKPDKTPYILPKGWEWQNLESIFYPISVGKNKIKTSDIEMTGMFPVVDQGKQYVSGFYNKNEKVIKIPGPVIIFGDHTRELKLVDFDFVAGADGVKILRPLIISENYFFIVLKSLAVENRGYGRHYKLLLNNLFPLPPLSEQKRIVAKVDELMALCDELESSLSKSQTDCDRLMEAAVGEILAA